MSVDGVGKGSDITFLRELQSLLHAQDEADCHTQLLDCYGRRDVAGAALYQLAGPAEAPNSFHEIWSHTIADLPGEVPIQSLVQSVTGGMPGWMRSWLTRRRTHFSLSGITRFIPYTSQLLLRLASPKDVRPLADIVWSPYSYREHNYAMGIGLFKRTTPPRLEEINTLALAYIVKWTQASPPGQALDGDSPSDIIELTERELDCLRWLIAGKTLRDTADILGMSYANVRYHVDKAKQRLGYATNRQLMVRAAVDYDLSPKDGAKPGSSD